jgi:hypothetical protein
VGGGGALVVLCSAALLRFHGLCDWVLPAAELLPVLRHPSRHHMHDKGNIENETARVLK